MSVQTWPYVISIYKGENRLLIIPIIRHESGLSVDSDWFFNTKEMENCEAIGQGLYDAVNCIKKSPLSTKKLAGDATESVWRKNSGYKNWNSFWKNNECTRVQFFEDGHYEVYSLIRSEKYKGAYSEIAKKVLLPTGASKEEIGKSVIEVFNALEEYYDNILRQNGKIYKQLQLLDETTLTVKIPKDSHFEDSEDGSAAEIYQCYSYIPKEGAESSAEFFLSLAPELDCNLETTNIQRAWEEVYGQADYFNVKHEMYGIYNVRVELKNKETHKISYFLQMSNDLLLECGMDVHQAKKRKKLDEKLTQQFAEFALSCKI